MFDLVLSGAGVLLVVAGVRRLLPSRAVGAPRIRSRVRSALESVTAALVDRAEPAARRLPVLRHGPSADEIRRRCATAGSSAWASRLLLPVAQRGPDALASRLAALRLCGLLSGVIASAALVGHAGAVAAPAIPLLCAAGALAADTSLAIATRRAERQIEQDLPNALDLLAACAAAGLPFEISLALSACHAGPDLAGVLTRAAARQRAGQGPADALKAECDGLGIIDLAAVAAVIDRHHRLGLPLAPPLLLRAKELRARAHTAARERAARTSPLVAVVTATVITPACVVALGATVVGSMLASGIP
jgi:tight adherence protein C